MDLILIKQRHLVVMEHQIVFWEPTILGAAVAAASTVEVMVGLVVLVEVVEVDL
jgi:hypothetical protein